MTTEFKIPGVRQFGGMLGTILKSGFKSSEFVLSLLAVVLVPLLAIADPAVAAWASSNGWVGGLVAAVYTAARAYVKGTAAKNEVAASVIQATTPPLTTEITGRGALTAEQIRNLPTTGNPKEL